MRGPQGIVCVTEETTEWLYVVGEEERIVGISGDTVRPRRARDETPRIASFLDGRSCGSTRCGRPAGATTRPMRGCPR